MIINKESFQDILAHLRDPEMIVKTSMFFTLHNQDNSLDLTIDYIEPQNIHITDGFLQIGDVPEVYSISLPVDNIDMTDVVSDGTTGEKIMRFELLSVRDFTVALIIRIES